MSNSGDPGRMLIVAPSRAGSGSCPLLAPVAILRHRIGWRKLSNRPRERVYREQHRRANAAGT